MRLYPRFQVYVRGEDGYGQKSDLHHSLEIIKVRKKSFRDRLLLFLFPVISGLLINLKKKLICIHKISE